MSEPENLTLQMLRELRDRFDKVDETLAGHTKRFDHLDEQIEAMTGYVTYAMGKSGENRADIEQIMADMKDLQARVSALEAAE